MLTVKDLLAATVQLANRDAIMDPKLMRWPPLWFETTFNLETELPEFVAYYQQRALKFVFKPLLVGVSSNHWLVQFI